MGFKKSARNNGLLRPPALKLPRTADAAPIRIIGDWNKEPEPCHLHDLGTHRRRCEGEGCKLCAADVPLRKNWTVVVDLITDEGEATPRTMWLNPRDYRACAEVVPESGTAELVIDAVEDTESENKRDDGTSWHNVRFRLAVDVDNA